MTITVTPELLVAVLTGVAGIVAALVERARSVDVIGQLADVRERLVRLELRVESLEDA